MVKTLNNMEVSFTKDGAIYKKDVAKLLAMYIMQHVPSVVLKNIRGDVNRIEMTGASDNYKVKVSLKIKSEDIYRIMITYVFRKNGEVKAYATLYGGIVGSIDCPNDGTNFNIDEYGDAILLDNIPAIHSKNELDDFANDQLVPRCKQFQDEVMDLYNEYSNEP